MRLSGRLLTVVLVAIALMIVVATDQILPATSPYQAQMRVWLAARATGLVALVLIAVLVVLGILVSHPEQTQWRLVKVIFPWHESLWVFVLAFLLVHIVSIVLDPYAGVGIRGALVPGLSAYRTAPVAVGVLSLYALLITVLTARYTRLLPAGWWLKLHRLAGLVLAGAWVHGVLSGTDTIAVALVYWIIVLAVVAAAAHRYWIVRRARAALLLPGPVRSIPVQPLVEEVHVQSHPAP
jgi:methionine sulfoxide reductase heme-binding subunit